MTDRGTDHKTKNKHKAAVRKCGVAEAVHHGFLWVFLAAAVLLVAGLLMMLQYFRDLRINREQTAALAGIASTGSAAYHDATKGYATQAGTTPGITAQANAAQDGANQDGANQDGMLQEGPNEVFLASTPSPFTFSNNALLPLFKTNSDTVGWIRLEETRIDYPVVKGNRQRVLSGSWL